MGDFAIQILFNEQYKEADGTIKFRPRIVILDAVEDNQVQASNTVTDHPIVSGDMVADHSYKNPMTMTISGSASMTGNKGVIVDSNGISLANLEELFMTLKNEAYFCEIIKLNTSNINDIRFTRKSQMVLTNIVFTEKINTLDYQLTFRQVFVAKVQTLDPDPNDQYLPDITEPPTLSFTETLMDWDSVNADIIQVLRNEKLISNEFLQYLGTIATSSALGAIVGVWAAGVVVGALTKAGILVAASTAAVAAFVVVAVVAVVAVLVVGIVKLFKRNKKKKKYAVEQFKLYDDDQKNKQEVERFSNFLSEISKQLEQLNTAIQVWQISADSAQECLITIDNNYYIFTFTKNNTDGTYKCVVTTAKDEVRATVSNVFSSPTNFADLTDDNFMFRADETGSRVYLINCNPEGENKLTNFFVLSSAIKPSDFNDAVEDIIKNAIIL